ncbi:hypothetical protein [Paraburkholderia sp. LEh10]|jgi:hypothetical protein|uniref:hypothetical protein n=1 Tax=Paraburkholderia sp. LEh10 TaxID=2821353 RepID=UPI001AE40FB3|nr:hypothetical protein [Paraburkholderia sp. LEh10]
MAKNFSVTITRRRTLGGTRRIEPAAAGIAVRGTPPAHEPHRICLCSRHVCHEDFTILTIIGQRLDGVTQAPGVRPGGMAAAVDGSFQVAPMV